MDNATENIPLEKKFQAPDGSVDFDAAQAHLQRLQARSNDLSTDEIREAIQLVRILRRTNTGPAASRKRTAGKATSKVMTNPDDLLDL